MSAHASLLLVAPPGPFRDGLRVLLQAEPRIVSVRLADTVVDACCALEQSPPDVFIIDTNLPDPALWSFCTSLKTLASPVRCVVIIHTGEQRMAAQMLGLPALLAGFQAEALFAAILDPTISLSAGPD